MTEVAEVVRDTAVTAAMPFEASAALTSFMPPWSTDRVPRARKSEATPDQVFLRPLVMDSPDRVSVTMGFITSVISQLLVVPLPPVQALEVTGVK